MDNKLEIKFRNQKQSFEILEDEIIVDLATSKHKLKYNVPLEEIKKTHFITKTKEDGFFLISLFSFILNFLFLSYLIIENYKLGNLFLQSSLLTISLVSIWGIKAFFDGYDEKHLDASKLLYFIYTKKNVAKVDQFIELIYTKQKDYFRKKYFVIDAVLPYNVQYERYLWLYTNNYINDNEYEIIKEDLDKYFNFNPTI
ncbi:MAG: hypothetical protein ACRC6O_10150 [Flavobacterium sp.]